MAYGSIVENLIKALAKEGKTRLEHMARNSINSGGSISGSTHANAEEEGITGIFKKLFGSKEVTNAVNTAANATNNMTNRQYRCYCWSYTRGRQFLDQRCVGWRCISDARDTCHQCVAK